MPTQIYRNKAGKRVPGTTTIISRFKESGGLIHWAWQQGVDGKDYRDTRDAAAGAGTICHEMVECDIRGRQFDPSKYDPELVRKAQSAYVAYEQWKKQTKLKPVETELPLVSEEHQFGGTLDSMLVDELLALGDWKTSGSVREDYLYQLAAYGILWDENYPDRPITGGFHLLRFAKDFGDFGHHYYPELERQKRAFILMREMYDISAETKKRAA